MCDRRGTVNCAHRRRIDEGEGVEDDSSWKMLPQRGAGWEVGIRAVTGSLLRPKAVCTFSEEHQRARCAQDTNHANDKPVQGYGWDRDHMGLSHTAKRQALGF